MEVLKVIIKNFTIIEKQSDLDESNQKRAKTQKLINRIIENTEKKQGKQKSNNSKSSFGRDNAKSNNLSPENLKDRDSGRSNELQRLMSPKPPKPSRIDSSSNILSQSNNSMNISQLLRETNPNNDKTPAKKRSPIRLPDSPKDKIKILKKEDVQMKGKMIDINSTEQPGNNLLFHLNSQFKSNPLLLISDSNN